ncbi:MAG: aldolase/citrate lyase family protein, partial [Pseudomonadota bacterium]
GVFIGPADLSADLGYPGEINHPEARSAVMAAIARIAASDKWAGTLSTDPDYIAEARGAGARFLAVAVDVLTLGAGLREVAGAYRGD